MKTEHLQPRMGAASSFYRVNILSLFPSLTPKLPATFLVLCPSLSSAIFLVEVYRKIVSLKSQIWSCVWGTCIHV